MQSQSVLPQLTTKHSRVMTTPKLRDVLPNSYQPKPLPKSNKPGKNILPEQEIICRFFLSIVKKWSPDLVLYEFNQLFVDPAKAVASEPRQALQKIIFVNDEKEFRNTLKRCCYILINNWIAARQSKTAQDLVQLFSNLSPSDRFSSPTRKTLNTWLLNFVNSPDYQELKLFVFKYEVAQKDHWKYRYASYLLAPEYVNSKNTLEQRQAAKGLAKQLKEQFKFELAMYTARSQPVTVNDRRTQNPTALGDDALRLVKKVLAKRGWFNHASLANIFLKQTQQLKYKYFKQSLLKYLFYSTDNQGLVETLQTKVSKALESFYEEYSEKELDSSLLLKTCNRVIECLTVKRNGEPSSLFISLASQGKSVTLAMLLLKIILISPYSRTHLEVCLAKIIQYYECYPQEECFWVINFLEVSKVTLAIHTENIQYNLVNMEDDDLTEPCNVGENAYRVFSHKCER